MMSALKLTVVTAVLAVGITLGGAGLAHAAPTPDVGVPEQVPTIVVAPDGVSVPALSAHPFGGHGVTARVAARASGSINLTITTPAARLRASVPNGGVIGLAYPGQTAWGGCQVPGSDGYVWGWISVNTGAGWRNGWMRHDLWEITENDYPGGGHGVPNHLPWC